jgi:dTDP-4-amino-4,6-dideoxygalactose transaminase
MINVTRTYLPDFEKYSQTLKRAWDKGWITNNGELVVELEQKLKQYLGVKHLFFTNNGTVVLQMALKAYDITGEVITTPFSYVATLNAILWEKCTPVFADIRRDDFCIDAARIEEKITEKTQAILATHVYGYPCDIDAISKIAEKYNLKVIYDGAHSFGCRYRGKSLLSYGDISTCSFHATKIFHTIEGGCIVTEDDAIARKLMLYRQFGHVYDEYLSEGINAKNSEAHAAMGLCILPDLPSIIQQRKALSERYSSLLNARVTRPASPELDFNYNYAYYPVLMPTEAQLIAAIAALGMLKIHPRRYFHPSLNKLPYLNYKESPVSEDIASRVMCLPLFVGLEDSDVVRICEVINEMVCR